jgi:hypothetical protein
MARIGNNKRPNVKYQKLKDLSQEEDAEYHDDQFVDSPPQIPVKSIVLAIFLFIIGSVLLTLAVLMIIGIVGVNEERYTSIPVLVVGLITFIPGFYHVRIAYYACKGYQGYSYADIPSYD